MQGGLGFKSHDNPQDSIQIHADLNMPFALFRAPCEEQKAQHFNMCNDPTSCFGDNGGQPRTTVHVHRARRFQPVDKRSFFLAMMGCAYPALAKDRQTYKQHADDVRYISSDRHCHDIPLIDRGLAALRVHFFTSCAYRPPHPAPKHLCRFCSRAPGAF